MHAYDIVITLTLRRAHGPQRLRTTYIPPSTALEEILDSHIPNTFQYREHILSYTLHIYMVCAYASHSKHTNASPHYLTRVPLTLPSGTSHVGRKTHPCILDAPKRCQGSRCQMSREVDLHFLIPRPVH